MKEIINHNLEKGFVIYEDDVRVAIGTMSTSNIKTGNMVQVWILDRNTEPHILVKNGGDHTVCGSCPLRNGNGCYVTVHQAPLQVFRSWKRGIYSNNYDAFLDVVENSRSVRFGAYGDPSFIDYKILFQIANRCKDYTGYTHQWRNKGFDPIYLNILKPSVDNERQLKQLARLNEENNTNHGYFRLVDDYSQMQEGEIICDSDAFGTQCINCLKCKGNDYKIVIKKHGSKAKKIKTVAA